MNALGVASTQNQINKHDVLFITSIVSFLIPFMISAVNIALPAIGNEYRLNVITLSWITTSYMLASASLMVPLGRFADIRGKRNVFISGIIVFLLGTVLSIVSVSGVMLIATRLVQGIGGAAIFATAIPILISVFPNEERGKALGIITAVTYLGLSLGPFIGGLLTQRTGWKSIFIFCAAFSLLALALTFWKLKRAVNEKNDEKFDMFGSVIYCLALAATIYGLSALPSTAGIIFLSIGIGGGILFFWWENKTKYPLIRMDLFRHNRSFTFSNMAALINYSGSWAVSFLLSLYLQYVKGFSAETAGIILIANPVIQAIFSPVTGRLSDKVEPRILASAGMAITTVGIGMLVFLSEQTSLVYIIASLIILGFGFALFSSPNTNAVMSSVNKQYYGFASATLSTMRQVGMMLSMGITMVIFTAVIGRVQITPEYNPAFINSTHILFTISALLCFGAIFASMARGNIHDAMKK
jgi:EmrB/QacA subfamily drug resistance transporter